MNPIDFDPGPLFLILAASLAVLTCGFALRRTLLALLRLPVGERRPQTLLIPYIALLIAAVVAVGSLPLIFSVPGTLTYPFALLVGSAVATAIWLQFISKVLTVPPERFRR
ncbi:hypothetical protein [Gloeobacter kilaueensis]|uniref:Uncharacterized protein n=1 Tax=Gloeobacter kilaueensis (strain ATCC BAA-2537 / CCAP 1431/1 / ULC 316 / JS1) TaxID=1183438 RepID=U5QD39_GLOK1|nr:hypothetical protein [Gloeobacter kilaueensis]AGY56778.1 hypothetical protein GKIL_0532 [Gloeobacter kilaueensis JS1]